MTTPVISDYTHALRLDGRGVVVLGAGPGIGGAVCDALGQAGGKVLCVDLNGEHAKQAADRCGGTAFIADVADRSALERVFSHADTLFGSDFFGIVDVVGIVLPGTLTEHDDESTSRQFDLVLHHAIRVSQIGIPILAKHGRGSVVFMGSFSGFVSQLKMALYSVSKAGLHQLTKVAAQEFGPSGVRVNAVAPGRIANSGTVHPSAAEMQPVVDVVPLRRGGEPSDIAAATLFLLSDLASYISGVVLPVDGGIGAVSPLPRPKS